MWVCPKCDRTCSGPLCLDCGRPAVATASRSDGSQPLIGEVVNGRYRVEGLIGAGGMGTVYRAVQLSTGAPVAFKLLTCPPGASAKDTASLVRRFRREAHVLSQLHHPHTVRVVDFGEIDTERFYLVMELLEGSSLADELKRCGCLPSSRTAQIARQVCEALTEAHRQEIFHRDLKPSNVFLVARPDSEGTVKVVDFGIAKAPATDSSALTRSDDMLGTQHYMAPEQIKGETIGSYTDLYALGALLFRMLTGSDLFPGESGPVIAYHHIHSPPPVLVLPGQPRFLVDRWQRLLNRLLAKAPAERLADAAVVADMLDAIARLGEQSAPEFSPDPHAAAAQDDSTTMARLRLQDPLHDQPTPVRPRVVTGKTSV